MNRIHRLIALILLSCPIQATAAGWDDYKPYSIARMKADHAGVNEDMDFHFTPGIPFRSTVRYLGKTRDIRAERLIFIEMWAQSHRMSSVIVEAFEKEIQVKEDGKSYWLPIQSVLIPHIEKEVKENASVTLFLVFAGAIKSDQVFLVNEFKAR